MTDGGLDRSYQGSQFDTPGAELAAVDDPARPGGLALDAAQNGSGERQEHAVVGRDLLAADLLALVVAGRRPFRPLDRPGLQQVEAALRQAPLDVARPSVEMGPVAAPSHERCRGEQSA